MVRLPSSISSTYTFEISFLIEKVRRLGSEIILKLCFISFSPSSWSSHCFKEGLKLPTVNICSFFNKTVCYETIDLVYVFIIGFIFTKRCLVSNCLMSVRLGSLKSAETALTLASQN